MFPAVVGSAGGNVAANQASLTGIVHIQIFTENYSGHDTLSLFSQISPLSSVLFKFYYVYYIEYNGNLPV